jgi:hypothetical protein
MCNKQILGECIFIAISSLWATQASCNLKKCVSAIYVEEA